MAFHMPHIQKATSWDGWQIGPVKARMVVMVGAEDSNITEAIGVIRDIVRAHKSSR